MGRIKAIFPEFHGLRNEFARRHRQGLELEGHQKKCFHPQSWRFEDTHVDVPIFVYTFFVIYCEQCLGPWAAEMLHFNIP